MNIAKKGTTKEK